MSFDALRASMLSLQFDMDGVAVTITRPAPDTVALTLPTGGIWMTPLDEQEPTGTDFSRRDPRKVMAVARTETLPTLPRGTLIVAAELDGGTPYTWRVDGYERPLEPDLMRVILVRVADQ